MHSISLSHTHIHKCVVKSVTLQDWHYLTLRTVKQLSLAQRVQGSTQYVIRADKRPPVLTCNDDGFAGRVYKARRPLAEDQVSRQKGDGQVENSRHKHRVQRSSKGLRSPDHDVCCQDNGNPRNRSGNHDACLRLTLTQTCVVHSFLNAQHRCVESPATLTRSRAQQVRAVQVFFFKCNTFARSSNSKHTCAGGTTDR